MSTNRYRMKLRMLDLVSFRAKCHLLGGFLICEIPLSLEPDLSYNSSCGRIRPPVNLQVLGVHSPLVPRQAGRLLLSHLSVQKSA